MVNAGTGEAVQRLDYDAFGVVQQNTNPGFQPFGFAGGLFDLDTGLVRFGARDYDVRTGRWTSKDRLGFGGDTTNLYEHVGGNPNDFVDWLGLYVTIKLYPGAHGLGHIGIGVNTPNTSGFYPVPGACSWRTATR